MVAVNEKSCIFAMSFICRVKSVELIMASRKQSGSYYIHGPPRIERVCIGTPNGYLTKPDGPIHQWEEKA